MCGIYAYITKNNLNVEDILNSALKIKHRGPDNTSEYILQIGEYNIYLMFHRLAINGLTETGNQPMKINDKILICNGEIYNYQELAKNYNIDLYTGSDCEIIPYLYEKVGIEMINLLDGVFSFVLIDIEKGLLFIGHDPIGIRSLYYSINENELGIASELKALNNQFNNIRFYDPGMYSVFNFQNGFFNHYKYFNLNFNIIHYQESEIIHNIYSLLNKAVKKRLLSDRPICCLLSGGLDSSIITALTVKHLGKENVRTFSIGLQDSTDIIAAQKVADYLGTNHTSVILSVDEMINGIEDTIYQIESFDTTTIRASTPMYLLSRYISQNTQIKVVLSGEGSDEASGSYLYFHNAPSSYDFQEECIRLINDVQYFDVLRGDKTTAGTGLEIRVPFFDKEFINYYMSIDPSLKMVRNNYEKFLLRKAFENELPEDIVWRRKEGFSDGVSKMELPWYQIIENYTMNNFNMNEKDWYKEVFNKFYPNNENIIPYYWMPKWSGNLDNPSGRLIIGN